MRIQFHKLVEKLANVYIQLLVHTSIILLFIILVMPQRKDAVARKLTQR